jgi:hypothetical protein
LVLDPTQIGLISQIGFTVPAVPCLFLIGFTVPCHRPSAQGVLKKSGTAEQGLMKLMGWSTIKTKRRRINKTVMFRDGGESDLRFNVNK